MVFVKHTDSSAVIGVMAHHNSLQIPWPTDQHVCHVIMKSKWSQRGPRTSHTFFFHRVISLYRVFVAIDATSVCQIPLTSKNTLRLLLAFPSTTCIDFHYHSQTTMSTKYITDEDHQRQMLIEDLEAELSHWRLRSRSGERRFAERYHKVPLTSTGLVVERQRHPKERWPNCRKEYHNQLGSQIEDHPKSVKATASYPARDRKSKGRARKLENSSDEEDDSVTPSDSVSNYTSPK